MTTGADWQFPNNGKAVIPPVLVGEPKQLAENWRVLEDKVNAIPATATTVAYTNTASSGSISSGSGTHTLTLTEANLSSLGITQSYLISVGKQWTGTITITGPLVVTIGGRPSTSLLTRWEPGMGSIVVTQTYTGAASSPGYSLLLTYYPLPV